MVNKTLHAVLRWLAAVVVLVFFLYWSAFLALLMGFDTGVQRPQRVVENWDLLVASVIAGLLGVVGARLVLRCRVLSWWLLLALPLPAVIAADQASWLG